LCDPGDRQALAHERLELSPIKTAACGVKVAIYCHKTMLLDPIPDGRRVTAYPTSDLRERQSLVKKSSKRSAIHA